jgi:hypothetical protein
MNICRKNVKFVGSLDAQVFGSEVFIGAMRFVEITRFGCVAR